MDTKIPDGPPDVDLHSTPKLPHVVTLGVSSAATAQAHPDDGVNYLQQVLLVSITRAIMMCTSIVLRHLLRLPQKGVRIVSCCLTNWSGYANRSCFPVKVARAPSDHPFWVTTSSNPLPSPVEPFTLLHMEL